MARIQYSRSSPYATTPQSRNFIGVYKHRSIPRSLDDTPVILEARHAFRPDKLSQELYGTPKLWWVFTARNLNVLRDPLNDFKPGLLIYVPSYPQLKKVLGI